MIVIEDLFKSKFEYNTYVALGSFDGLHLGHMKLIKMVTGLAKQKKIKSMVFTFKNHPLSIINRELAPKLIMNNENKIELLRQLGIDIVNIVNFDSNFMKISPEEFINKIVSYYKVKGIIVGFNYRFGYKNLGDVDFLKKICSSLNVELYTIGPVKLNGEIVSSSKIRNLVSEGDISKANRMLTRPFILSGKIITGNQIGRTIGFPTINLDYNREFIIPCGGVYYSVVEYDGHYYKGITNVGYNPTVYNNKLSIETHILDFDKDIYGEYVELNFIERIRDEKKFNSLDDLKMQLEKDKKYVYKQKINLQWNFNLL